jgi:hypothetical protein
MLPTTTSASSKVSTKRCGSIRRIFKDFGGAPLKEVAFDLNYLGINDITRGAPGKKEYLVVDSGDALALCRHRFDFNISDYVALFHKVGKNTEKEVSSIMVFCYL